VAEDAITTGDLPVVLAEVARVVTEVLPLEEKGTLLQDVKVQVADLEATEVQLQEKVVLAGEANPEVHQLQEQAVSLTDLQDHPTLQDVTAVPQKDRQDVLKVLVTHQEKKDQEEVKSSPPTPLKGEGNYGIEN
jgi:hypothetical protein